MKNKRGAKGFVPKLYLKTRTGGSVDSIAVITKPDTQLPQTTAAVPSTAQEPALVAPLAPPPPPPPVPAAPAAVLQFFLVTRDAFLICMYRAARELALELDYERTHEAAQDIRW